MVEKYPRLATRHRLEHADHIGLLQSFSRTESYTQPKRISSGDAHRRLWEADASHRVKNLAQMCYSLSTPSVRQRFNLSDEIVSEAVGSLAESYRELSHPSVGTELLPCADLLARISGGLVSLFNGGRPIIVLTNFHDVRLPAIQRRALVLIASELIINCLKYAFPQNSGGTIKLSLRRGTGGIVLRVKDNGVGLGAGAGKGSGSALICELLAILEGKIVRRDAHPGLEATVSQSRSVSSD
ncbi:ATP-binding protein [Qipengyuania sp.]|uniref:ATP-binding protein n=1 Tax=Qipengyuania sp. TaxID=2004515 RepID=UPI0035C81975